MPPPTRRHDDKVLAPTNRVSSRDEVRLEWLWLLEPAVQDRVELHRPQAEQSNFVSSSFGSLYVRTSHGVTVASSVRMTIDHDERMCTPKAGPAGHRIRPRPCRQANAVETQME